MSDRHCPKKRLFLAQASASLGLMSGSLLFQRKVFAQSANPKKNVIFIFFNHGANIPYERDYMGGFRMGNGSNLTGLAPHAGDSLFVRRIDHTFTTENNNTHMYNQAAAFTGHPNAGRGERQKDLLDGLTSNPFSGTSIDIIVGNYLKQRYGTIAPYLTLGYAMNKADSKDHSNTFAWKTATFRDPKSPVFPIINPNNAYNLIKNEIICSNIGQSGPLTDAEKAKIAQEIQRLNVLKDNLATYKSSFFMPKNEMAILERQIGNKISRREQLLNPSSGGPPINDDSGNLTAKECKNFSFKISIRAKRHQAGNRFLLPWQKSRVL